MGVGGKLKTNGVLSISIASGRGCETFLWLMFSVRKVGVEVIEIGVIDTGDLNVLSCASVKVGMRRITPGMVLRNFIFAVLLFWWRCHRTV